MPNPENTFTGFDLMHVTTLSQYSSTPGRNLSAAGYTKATFYARGSLGSGVDVKIEVSDDGDITTADPCITLSANGTDDHCSDNGADPLAMTPGTLSSSWQPYTIMIPNSALTSIKDFFKATLVFNPPFPGYTGNGTGGTVYFDAIAYSQ